MLAFSNPDIIRMAREDFIPVVGDDWYERRRQDAEADFFRKVSDQAGRGSAGPSGGSTRQGIYCLTASGKLLSFKNAGQSPEETHKSLRLALDRWKRLAADERRPGAVKVPEMAADSRFAHAPPPAGLILTVYTRLLDGDEKGGFSAHETRLEGALREPQRDHLWLTEEEWKSLIPARPKVGDQAPVPRAIAQRIFRFHLADSTPGEPIAWAREHLRSGALALTVEERNDTRIKLRLEGSALLSTSASVQDAERGLDAHLLGYLIYDLREKRIERFDIIALGECSGKQAICHDQQREHRLLGVAFELAKGDSPANRVPPQAARWLEGYWHPER